MNCIKNLSKDDMVFIMFRIVYKIYIDGERVLKQNKVRELDYVAEGASHEKKQKQQPQL